MVLFPVVGGKGGEAKNVEDIVVFLDLNVLFFIIPVRFLYDCFLQNGR